MPAIPSRGVRGMTFEIRLLQGFYLTEGEAAEVTILPTTTAAAPRSKWTGWYNSYNPYSTEDTEGDFEERLALDPVR